MRRGRRPHRSGDQAWAPSDPGTSGVPTEHALADAIAAVASDRDRAAQLGARAKQKAAREFSVVAMVDAYESVYANLASSSSSRD
jgi:glycosyltransferase involved in cell wall biosynthesis